MLVFRRGQVSDRIRTSLVAIVCDNRPPVLVSLGIGRGGLLYELVLGEFVGQGIAMWCWSLWRIENKWVSYNCVPLVARIGELQNLEAVKGCYLSKRKTLRGVFGAQVCTVSFVRRVAV